MNTNMRRIIVLLMIGLGMVSATSLQHDNFLRILQGENSTMAPTGNSTATMSPTTGGNTTSAPSNMTSAPSSNGTSPISGAMLPPEVVEEEEDNDDMMETNSTGEVGNSTDTPDDEPIIEGPPGNIFEQDDGTEDDSAATRPPVNMSSTVCTITGGNYGFSVNPNDNSLTCDATDACQGATIVGCSKVTCGDRDCTNARIYNSGEILCKGESGCRNATIGIDSAPVDTVTCIGAAWTCYQAKIVATTTVICEDDSGEGQENANSVCGFATLTTPCLQCLGTNHGCGGGNSCKWDGGNGTGDCPLFRYGGTSCDAACPENEECPVNKTLPNGDKAPNSGARTNTALVASAVVGLFMTTFGLW